MSEGYKICGHKWGRWQDEKIMGYFELTLSCPDFEGYASSMFTVNLTGKKEGEAERVIYENTYATLAEASQDFNSIKASSLTS